MFPFPAIIAVVYLALRNGQVTPAVLLELHVELGDGGRKRAINTANKGSAAGNTEVK